MYHNKHILTPILSEWLTALYDILDHFQNWTDNIPQNVIFKFLTQAFTLKNHAKHQGNVSIIYLHR